MKTLNPNPQSLGILKPTNCHCIFPQVYLCSDYLELAVDMRSTMLATGRYEPAEGTTCHVKIVGKGAGEEGARRGEEREAEVATAGVGVPTGVPSAVAWGELTHQKARMKWLPRRPYFVGTERDQVEHADIIPHPLRTVTPREALLPLWGSDAFRISL